MKLTGWVYSQEFDKIFALSYRELKMSRNVSVREMTCDEWPHIKYYSSLIILLELTDVRLLLLTLNDA